MNDDDDEAIRCRRCDMPIQLVTDKYRSYWVHLHWAEECQDGPHPPEGAEKHTHVV